MDAYIGCDFQDDSGISRMQEISADILEARARTAGLYVGARGSDLEWRSSAISRVLMAVRRLVGMVSIHSLVYMPEHHQEPHVLFFVQLAPRQPGCSLCVLDLFVRSGCTKTKQCRQGQRKVEIRRSRHCRWCTSCRCSAGQEASEVENARTASL